MKTLQEKLADLRDAIHRRAREAAPADVLREEPVTAAVDHPERAAVRQLRLVALLGERQHVSAQDEKVPGHIRDGFAETVADGPELFAELLRALDSAAGLPHRSPGGHVSRRR